MKKKWTALKRRWRKLHRIDRQSCRLIGAFTLLYRLALKYGLIKEEDKPVKFYFEKEE